jgi:membrane associated rhomboid family serine protease
MSIFRDFGAASRRNAAPGTTVLVVAIIACFVIGWSVMHDLPGNLLFEANPSWLFSHPWSLVTYPFSDVQPVSILFAALALWGFGGQVERELSTARFIVVWLAFSALAALCLLVGAQLFHLNNVPLMTAWVPISMVLVMWGTRNPNTQMMFMFVIPIAGKWLAWLAAALVFFAVPAPEVAPFAAIPCILAYFFAANKIAFLPYSRGDQKYIGKDKKWERYNKSYYEEVQRREKEREERERLRKLFEGSLNDDPDK